MEEKNFTVGDFMATKLITMTEEMNIFDAVETLLKNNISGAPVVNDKNEIIGMFSERDCMKVAMDSAYHNQPGGKVKEYMNKEIDTINPGMAITSVARKFFETRFRRFPVVDKGKLVGQISRHDVMKAIHEMKRSTWIPKK